MLKVENVKSSHIKAAWYDPDSNTLFVQFRNGDVYKYAEVPEEVWQNFLLADSLGKYMHRHIKGKFTHAKVEGEG